MVMIQYEFVIKNIKIKLIDILILESSCIHFIVNYCGQNANIDTRHHVVGVTFNIIMIEWYHGVCLWYGNEVTVT